jgi:hypothetical protein
VRVPGVIRVVEKSATMRDPDDRRYERARDCERNTREKEMYQQQKNHAS